MFILDQQCEQMIRPLVASVGKTLQHYFSAKRNSISWNTIILLSRRKCFLRGRMLFLKRVKWYVSWKSWYCWLLTFQKRSKGLRYFQVAKERNCSPLDNFQDWSISRNVLSNLCKWSLSLKTKEFCNLKRWKCDITMWCSFFEN